ncbi:MAG: hypothetical protein ACFFDN_28230 [Candidatus Hodarchaeota archaeon]
MTIHELIVIRSGGLPFYVRKLDSDILLKSGFYKAIYDFGRQEDSCLSRIEFINGRFAYCQYFEEKDLLFFMTVDSFHFKEGIILKMQRLYDEIFKNLEPPTAGKVFTDEKTTAKVEEILLETPIKRKLLAYHFSIQDFCQNILKNEEIKAISIHTLDNTYLFGMGCEFDNKIKNWLLNWNLVNPPAPYEYEFGNYLDEKTLQAILMNSGIGLGPNNNFILYYIFGEAANLGYYMDRLSSKLNKIIG